MDTGGRDKLDLLFRLAGLNQEEFRETLDEAIREGYVTKADFERFVHVMSERLDSQERVSTERADAQDELLKLKVENVELKLQRNNQEGLDRYIEEKLPAAVDQYHRDQRSNFVNFLRQRAMLIVSIILVFTSAIGWYAAFKNASDVRDLKNLSRLADEIDDTLR